MRVKRLYILVGLLIAARCATGQTMISGSVVDKETKKPVPFASIGIVGTSRGTSTNLNGQFSLALPTPASIKITCVGYESITVNSSELPGVVELSSMTTQLGEVFVVAKAQNPKSLVRKAFASIGNNYPKTSFLQTFFYRHYCKDDSVYGRLIEASVDVWKHQGYKSMRTQSGENEEIRVTQLRRSLDKTVMAQGHEPISIGNLLGADIVGYQPQQPDEHLKFFEETTSLRTNFEKFNFTLEGATIHDGIEVYKINYESKPDSLLTTSGYVPTPFVNGSLYITMNNLAIIKYEDEKTEGPNIIRTSAYYRKLDDRYYPYHFIREGESRFTDGHAHSFHLELVSVDIQHDEQAKFTSHEPGKADLLKIPYDSVFWSTTTLLKTTPLEDDIIQHLGGGKSLQEQFLQYQKFEWSTTDGGQDGEEKLTWFLKDSRNERPLYLCFLTSQCQPYLQELERLKKLARIYRGQVAFVLVMIEEDEVRWKQTVDRYTLFADGVLNYRIDKMADLLKQFPVKTTPAYFLINREGRGQPAPQPEDELVENELKALISSR